MNSRLTTFASGLGIGVAIAYLFDRDRGARHRALARDRVAHLYSATPGFTLKAGRDLGNRAQGFAAQTRSRIAGFNSNNVTPDYVLVERVRAKLGRYVSHPGAIHVTVRDGAVTLTGSVLRHEVDAMLDAIGHVRDVKSVENGLTVHADGAGIPELQGGVPRPGDRIEWRQRTWSPGARLTAVVGGGALGYTGARLRGLPGMLAGLGGTALIARGVSNVPLKHLLGFGESPRVIEIQKSINVDAPVDEVFRIWTDFEDYPRFMEHVQEVRRLNDGQLHWSVNGPAGSTVGWDAEVTELVDNEAIAWRTTNGSSIRQAGRVRFIENPNDGTRIDVHLAYNPPAGALGHMVATMFGVDPRHSMEEDLVRFQSLFTHGKTTAHGQTVTRQELEEHLQQAES